MHVQHFPGLSLPRVSGPAQSDFDYRDNGDIKAPALSPPAAAWGPIHLHGRLCRAGKKVCQHVWHAWRRNFGWLSRRQGRVACKIRGSQARWDLYRQIGSVGAAGKTSSHVSGVASVGLVGIRHVLSSLHVHFQKQKKRKEQKNKHQEVSRVSRTQ